jgi:hypothetical protein
MFCTRPLALMVKWVVTLLWQQKETAQTQMGGHSALAQK